MDYPAPRPNRTPRRLRLVAGVATTGVLLAACGTSVPHSKVLAANGNIPVYTTQTDSNGSGAVSSSSN